jgi:hypothetical protein
MGGDIYLQTLAAIDSILATNSTDSPTLISGAAQFPGYFDFAVSWWVNGTSNTK